MLVQPSTLSTEASPRHPAFLYQFVSVIGFSKTGGQVWLISAAVVQASTLITPVTKDSKGDLLM